MSSENDPLSEEEEHSDNSSYYYKKNKVPFLSIDIASDVP